MSKKIKKYRPIIIFLHQNVLKLCPNLNGVAPTPVFGFAQGLDPSKDPRHRHLPLSPLSVPPLYKTRSSAVAKTPRDASCLSVVASIVQYLERSFYRAMQCKRGLCCHAVSVCPSVRPSVCHVRGSRQNE